MRAVPTSGPEGSSPPTPCAPLTRGTSTPQSSPPSLQFICSSTFCTMLFSLAEWPRRECALMTCGGRAEVGGLPHTQPSSGGRPPPPPHLGGHRAVHAAQLLDGAVHVCFGAGGDAQQQLHFVLRGNTAQQPGDESAQLQNPPPRIKPPPHCPECCGWFARRSRGAHPSAPPGRVG